MLKIHNGICDDCNSYKEVLLTFVGKRGDVGNICIACLDEMRSVQASKLVYYSWHGDPRKIETINHKVGST
jgi:hypothetical protein